MKVDQDKLRTSVERCLNAAKNGERGSLRVHCKAAERLLHGAKNGQEKELLDLIHHAATSIENSRSVELLQKAYDLTHA